MANIGDDIVNNILVRLPGKSLLRFRCVSKHWNGLISDPYFMKTRSRPMILLPFPRPLAVVDDNLPAKDNAHSIVQIHCLLKKGVHVCVVGAFDGIVVLALTHDKSLSCRLVMYNPLTCALRTLLAMDISPPSIKHPIPFVFGFGDDFKIFRFERSNCGSIYNLGVFDLKTSSWSGRPRYLIRDFDFWGDAGMFLNGFLYWATFSIFIEGVSRILALNVKEMVFSWIKLPVQLKHIIGPLLGSIDGCLCMVSTFDATTFDLWVRKELGGEMLWLKARSFTIRLEPFHEWRPICIFGNGKILFTTRAMLLVMYDSSKDSYETFYGLVKSCNDFEPTFSALNFKDIRSIEYVENLVSPFDICFN